MVKDYLHFTLVDARARRIGWIEVARAVQALELQGLGDKSLLSPIRFAAEATGYSANQLRRMLSGLAFLNGLQEAEPRLRKQLGEPRFSHCEMLAKLWKADRTKLVELLQQQPVLRYESLYDLYSDVRRRRGPSSRSAGKLAIGALKQHCLRLLTRDQHWLDPFGSGDYGLVQPRVHHPYCKPAMLLRKASVAGSGRWIGIDFVTAFRSGQDASVRLLTFAAMEASFLDAFVIVMPEDSGAPDACEAIDHLQLTSVGLITAGDEALAWCRKPSSPPVPDRRRLWQPPDLLSPVAEFHLL